MKVAVLGGSFNPPHMCHVFISCYVLAGFDVDQVWLLPCYKHAFGKELVPFQHRFTMCCLAVESLRKNLVKVSAIEQERHGTSWTIDTVRYLKDNYPDHDFTWIIGSDVLSELDKWKDFEQLRHLVAFIVVPRAGSSSETDDRSQKEKVAVSEEKSRCLNQQRKETLDLTQNTESLKTLKAQFSRAGTFAFQFPDISSTLIRERVKQKKSIIHLVPKKIEEYIRIHKLYEK